MVPMAEPRIMQYKFQKYMQELNINGASFHTLRHTFATRCFEKGMSPKTVQEIMGHANINMTMSYTHVLDEALKNEAKTSHFSVWFLPLSHIVL